MTEARVGAATHAPRDGRSRLRRPVRPDAQDEPRRTACSRRDVRFEIVSLPEAEPILTQPDCSGSAIECWSVASVAPPIALHDRAVVIAAADALVDAQAITTYAIKDAPVGAAPRHWQPLSRSEARRSLLHPLRFSMAYGGTPSLGDLAALAVDAFLARFSEDARFFTGRAGFARLLKEDGSRAPGGGSYSVGVLLTGATFEMVVVAIDWDRAGLFLASDED